MVLRCRREACGQTIVDVALLWSRHASSSRRLDREPSDAAVQQHIRAIHRFYRAWSEDDVDAMLKVVDRDVTIEHAAGPPDGGRIYRGRRGIAELCDRSAARWIDLRCEVRDARARGRAVIAVIEVRADRPGETFAGRMVVACGFHGGRIVSLRPAPPG